VEILHTNNNNITATTLGCNFYFAAVAAVNFKKLKEKTLRTWTYQAPYKNLEKVMSNVNIRSNLLFCVPPYYF